MGGPPTGSAGWGALPTPAWGGTSPEGTWLGLGRERGSQGVSGMRGIPRLPWGRTSPQGKEAALLRVPGLRGQAEPASVHSLRQKC